MGAVAGADDGTAVPDAAVPAVPTEEVPPAIVSAATGAARRPARLRSPVAGAETCPNAEAEAAAAVVA